LHSLGYEAEFTAYRSNFAGLSKILAQAGFSGVDLILADLGVSSMQLDDPSRGFSMKYDGSLDMRMNPTRGQSAAVLLRSLDAAELTRLLEENADEPRAELIGGALAGKSFATTRSLASAVRAALPRVSEKEIDLSVRRAFQALRIAVNDEFSALDAFLRQLPYCLNPGGRVAILAFHSGEDRRVKKSFAAGRRTGLYSEVSDEVIRASAQERNSNPRSTSAKLRWARKMPND
jgi:16S rRNA (cytosine1402-N4)-methyltransferase